METSAIWLPLRGGKPPAPISRLGSPRLSTGSGTFVGLPLDFCRGAGSLNSILLRLWKAPLPELQIWQGQETRKVCSHLVLLNGVQVKVQLKPQRNQGTRCHLSVFYRVQ